MGKQKSVSVPLMAIVEFLGEFRVRWAAVLSFVDAVQRGAVLRAVISTQKECLIGQLTTN